MPEDRRQHVAPGRQMISRGIMILDDESELALEAVLFASPEPLGDAELGKIIGRMIRNGLKMSQEDKNTVIDYLATHFGISSSK